MKRTFLQNCALAVAPRRSSDLPQNCMASAAFCETAVFLFLRRAQYVLCCCYRMRGRRGVSLICMHCKTKVNPLRRSCVSKRSRCGAALGEPSAEIGALAVAPCEFVLSSANPMRRLCVSKRSRCGAVRICLELGEPSAEIVRVEVLSLWRRMCHELGEPSAEIVRVEALSPWRRANVSCTRRTLCGDRVCRSALALAPFEVRSALGHLRLRRQRLRTKLARKVAAAARNSQLLGAKVVREEHSRSSGC